MKVTAVLCALVSGGPLFGQAGDYAFATSTSTYVPLSSSATVVSALEADAGEDTVGIGFNFEFEGVSYDTVAATSDGYLSFVTGATSTSANNLDNGSSIRRPLVAPLWDDHDGRATGSQASYEVTGTAPNRVFTFEWKNWEWSYNASAAVVSFQVKLYETTNEIEFHYNWECATCITSPDASIGLSGANSFLSVTGVGTGTPTASNTVEDASIDTVVTNQVFSFTPPTCLAPSFAAATGVSPTSATINFSGGVGNYEVNWDTTGFIQGAATSNTSILATNTFTATGLSPVSTYDFYVRQDCGVDGYSSWTGPFSVTTACVAYTAPYSTDFDSDSDGQVAQCWEQYHTYTSAYARVETPYSWSALQPRSGANIMEIYSSNSGATDTLIAISPEFSDLTAGDKRVVFWAASQGTSNELYVATTSNATGKASINYIDTITFSGANTYQEVIVDFTTLTGYNGTDTYVVLQHNLGSTYSDIYIDDFDYEVIPACPKPTALSHANVTSASVDLSWQSNGSGPWYIYWGPCGFDQATPGVTIDTATTLGGYTLSGLTPGTSYAYYLFEECGVDFSDTIGGNCFKTSCITQSLPFTENFNGSLGCFEVVDGGTTNDTWLHVGAGGTTNVSGDFDGTGYALADSDGAGSGVTMDEYLISPAIDASSLTGALILDFDQWFRDLSSDEANVDVWDGSAWVNVLTQGTDAGSSFTNFDHQSIDVTAYANANFKVRFHYDDNATYAYHWAIDNFSLTEVNCLPSTNLASYAVGIDTISINWISGDGINYGVEYGPTGFLPGSGSYISAIDTFATATGLSGNTTYDFYVYDTCSAGNSIALGPITVTTLCNAILAPYLETFDDTTWVKGSSSGYNDAINECWTRNSNTGYKWSVYDAGTSSSNTGPDADHTGNSGNFLYTEASSSSPSLAQIVSPVIDITALSSPYVSFWYHRYGDPADMGDLLLEVNDGNGWDTLLTISGVQQTASTSPYQEIGADISSYGNAVQIRFTGVQKSTYEGDMAIDDFSVAEAPSCLPILNLTADGIVDSAAVMRWDLTQTAGSYQVWYGPQGFYQGTATIGGSKAITQYDSLLVDTLSQLTCYEFLVRGICTAGDTTLWTGPYSFCTPPSCPDPSALGVDPNTLTTGTADIYWTTGGSSNWNIEYGPSGFASGTGTSLNAVNDTTNIIGLSPATCYEFYVRDSCGVADVSNWVGPFSFCTPCVVNSAPYYESFNAGGWVADNSGNAVNSVIDLCWDRNPDNTSSYSWRVRSTSTASSSTGPNQDINGNGNYVFTEASSGSTGSIAELTSPSVDLTSTSAPILTFAYHFYGATIDRMYVDVFDGNSWTNGVDSIVGEQQTASTDAWKLDTVDLASYMSTTIQVRFRAVRGSSYTGDLAIDEVYIGDPATCFTPTVLGVSNVTTTSATTSWTTGGASNWNIEYGPVGFAIGNGTRITSVNTNPYTINGLTPGTCYEYYVRDSCGTNSVSLWGGPYSFTTVGAALTFPITEDFENGFTYFDNHCANGTLWGIQQAIYNGGSNAVKLAYQSNDTSLLKLRGTVDLTNTVAPVLMFAQIAKLEGGYDEGHVQISIDGGQTFTDLPGSAYMGASTSYSGNQYFDEDDYSIWGTTSTAAQNTWWVQEKFDLSAYKTSNVVIRFQIDSDGSIQRDGWYIDDIQIVEDMSCPMPTNVSVNNASCDSVEVSWTSDASSTSSYVEYGARGFVLGSGTVITNAVSPQTINGLMLNTEYDVYVVDSCSANESNPSTLLTFKTDSVGPVWASFTSTQSSTTMADAIVDFDGSASTGDGLTYDWDFGNSNTGTGVNAQGTYTGNGTYNVTLTVTDRCGNTDDTTVVVTIAGISIVENEYNAGIEMYPNPNNGAFKVNVTNGLGVYTIEVVDLSGRVVYQKGNIATGVVHNVELINKAKGVYMVRLKGEGLNVTQRIVID